MTEQLKHQLAGPNRHRFDVRSESRDQLNLTFEEDQAIAEAASAQHPETPTTADKAPPRHSREPLPDHLDRHEEILAPGDDCTRSGDKLKMQAPGQKKTKTARVWAYVRDERPWSGQSPSCAWYQFTINRKGEHPVSHLAGCKGWAHADGYSGFNSLFGDGKAHEMACMAHVRRKFVDVFTSQGRAIAKDAIRRIAELYAVETDARRKSPEKRVAVRQAGSDPSLMIWRPGCTHNCPKSLATRHWPRPSAMLLAGCHRPVHTLRMAIWNWITTLPGALSNLSPSAAKTGSTQDHKAAAKPWPSPSPSSKRQN